MAATFSTSYVKNVGSTEATLYTAPPGLTGRHLVVSLVATNIFGSAIPISAKLVQGSDSVYIAYNKRVLANDTIDLLINNSKIMIQNGDVIKVSAPVDDAFSIIMTVVEEVET
jgi:hypothetical protein|tara:strand:+ start:853 stop:1191 length:339 start_codon:yes stop_codon:yes gene_type:complete